MCAFDDKVSSMIISYFHSWSYFNIIPFRVYNKKQHNIKWYAVEKILLLEKKNYKIYYTRKLNYTGL